jgi:protein involved in polysaccharide export with SLBB domain
VANQRILDVHAASTVAKAITLAGGALDRGMLTRVSVLRGGQVLHTNVYPVLVNGEDTPENIALLPGDLVVVPVNTAKITVVGAVGRPGTYPMAQTSGTQEGPVRLSDALSLAGGPNGQHQSKIGKIGILRQNPNDTKITTLTVDYGHYLTRSDLSQNPVLQNNDLIVVQEEHHQGLGDFTQYFSLFWIMKAVGG